MMTIRVKKVEVTRFRLLDYEMASKSETGGFSCSLLVGDEGFKAEKWMVN